MLATASNPKSNAEITPVDKWRLFKQCTEENAIGVELWNVRRLLYQKDGAVISGMQTMVTDIVGTALDRGPPVAEMCRSSGDGLTHASVGQVARFTITACGPHGNRFEDGGDPFKCNIRFHCFWI